jgi:hypothetical protein
MAAKKKPAEKQTFLRPEDRLELLEALNKAKEVCDDCLEGGSSYTHIVHDANDKVRSVARKLGYKQETYYCNFTL